MLLLKDFERARKAIEDVLRAPDSITGTQARAAVARRCICVVDRRARQAKGRPSAKMPADPPWVRRLQAKLRKNPFQPFAVPARLRARLLLREKSSSIFYAIHGASALGILIPDADASAVWFCAHSGCRSRSVDGVESESGRVSREFVTPSRAPGISRRGVCRLTTRKWKARSISGARWRRSSFPYDFSQRLEAGRTGHRAMDRGRKRFEYGTLATGYADAIAQIFSASVLIEAQQRGWPPPAWLSTSARVSGSMPIWNPATTSFPD